jgi:tetratricopeptide (TPR) repeat protein/DNA-binding XRE family transcriptional regulator
LARLWPLALGPLGLAAGEAATDYGECCMAEDGGMFAIRLAGCRQLTGLSQKELAARSGLSVRTVGGLERGRVRWPHPDTVRRLADALDLHGQARDEFTADAHRRLAHAADEAEAAAPFSAGQSSPGAGPGAPVPRQLRLGVRDFTGRAAELSFLTGLLNPPRGPGGRGTGVVAAIGGMAGVGKTALAIHWAHLAARHFPDGQLYVNLRGFASSGAPATPAEALHGFLDALGVPPERIPAGQDTQAALYRSLLAERRMLIVLDNAHDEGQVRPLLPASPASMVIITSRNQLAGLAVTDGTELLRLDILPHNEAVRLLTVRIGASRATAEPAAIHEIARLCAHLPLALAVAAARAAARPGISLPALADELRDTAHRLDVLDARDPAVSVAAVFSWSYRQLGDDAARMFRLLSLHPGPDISMHAAASLAAVDEPQASRLLLDLARDCLLTEHAAGRYAFHDLLRAYAARQAQDRDSPADRDAAIGRILDYYLHTAARGALLLEQSRERIALAPARAGAAPEQPSDRGQALAWFEAEHQVLLAVTGLATNVGADSHAWQLPWAMTGYLHRRGYVHERVALLGIAVAAAARLDDALGQAVSLRALGSACIDAADHDQARAHLERCLSQYQRLDDRTGEAWAQLGLSRLAEAQGRYADALGHGEQALRIYQAIGHPAGQARVLNSLAWGHALLGDYHRGRRLCQQSLVLIATLGGCDFECQVWDTLGYIELHLGDFAQAAAHFECALSLSRENGDRNSEAEILTHVGDARHAAGELPQARQAWQQALGIYNEIQHPGADKLRAKLIASFPRPACR